MLKNLFKKLFAKGSCPDCGIIVACRACSKRYDAIDKEIGR